MRNAKCKMQMQNPICKMQYAKCNTQNAIHKMQYSKCNMQYAKYAKCIMQMDNANAKFSPEPKIITLI